jgi:hypothetical protein
MNRSELLREIREAFSVPTGKQREAYARFLHTLAAASVIGEATLIFAETPIAAITVRPTLALTVSGVLCFLAGALLARGE